MDFHVIMREKRHTNQRLFSPLLLPPPPPRLQGLGKTVQSMSFVHHLHTKLGYRGPFLVIAPLSTLPHWLREFEGWSDLNVVVYHGYNMEFGGLLLGGITDLGDISQER